MGPYTKAVGRYLLRDAMNVDKSGVAGSMQKSQMNRAQSQSDDIRSHLQDHERGLAPGGRDADHGEHDMNTPD